jgi:hypothetical protein
LRRIEAINSHANKVGGAVNPSWFEHVDLMQIALVTALGIIVWFFRQGLKSFQDTLTEHGRCIKDLYEKHNALAGEVSQLKGEHTARANMKKGCGT